jgi:type VI secretion system protein ImpL
MRIIYWLRDLLFNRQLWAFFGLILLSLLVWYVGPLIAIAEWRPLDLTWVRLVVIGLIFLIYILKLLFRWWQRNSINAKLLNKLAKVREEDRPGEKALGEDEVKVIQDRFLAAMSTLKKAKIQTTNKKEAWYKVFQRQYIYQLPWYVFIGAPGSGKTTALTQSGLTFPLADQYGKAALRGVGGTRNCDWWFTNEAVMIDTAGRYTTHESNAQLDKVEWTGFLGLLKKYRPRQPLNGVLLTISVADLLTMNQDQRTAQKIALRNRLHELRDELRIQLPVYILVTKTDLLSGFNEYFESLDKEDRAQIWGFTFPYNEKDMSSSTSLSNYSVEFEILLKRLYDELGEKLVKENDVNRRSLMYVFPQHFEGIRDTLYSTLTEIFTDSNYDEQPLLRGVYFTSGTQEGAPLDRILGALSRTFNTQEDSLRPRLVGQNQTRSYFLQDFLHKLVFTEAHLAGRNLVWEKRLKTLRILTYSICGLLLVGSLSAWLVSYANNKNYLKEVAVNVEKTALNLKNEGKTPQTNLLTLAQTLDQFRALPSSASFDVTKPPIPYTYGLYQGDKMQAATNTSYQRLLEDSLLPYVSKQIENLLIDPPQPNNLEAIYETLKAYLMLHEPEHFNAEFLSGFIGATFTQELGASIPKEQRDQIQAHTNALFSGRTLVSPYEKNTALVKSIRDKLATFSVAQLSYLRLKRKLNKNELGEFNIVQAAGPQAPLVFTFKSGKSLTTGIPSLFTYRGYHELFKLEAGSASAAMVTNEAWVLEPFEKNTLQKARDNAQGTLTKDIKRLYLNEYANLWEAYLNDVQLISSNNMQQSLQNARVLSAPDSPLMMFVRAAAKETTLTKQAVTDNGSLLGRAKDRVRMTKDDIENVFGTDVLIGPAKPTENLELIVDNRFDGLRNFAGDPNKRGSAPIDATISLINEMYVAMTVADAAIKAGNQPPSNDIAIKMQTEAARAPNPIRNLLTTLSKTSADQAASAARANIKSKIDTTLGAFCSKAIAGRYPVSSGASQDITLGDFSRFFGPGGLMDDFFQKNLMGMVDTTTKQWSYKRGMDGSSAGGSASLAAFQRAQTIRDIFFRNGPNPSVSINIKVSEMDASINQLTLDVDGQVLQYAHGPEVSQTMTWPGPRASNQIRLQLSPQTNGGTGVTTEGAWALYRFFDRAQIQGGGSSEKFKAAVTVQDRRVVFDVTANSAQNPFKQSQLQGFACP